VIARACSGSPNSKGGQFMEVAWVAFANDVAEKYMTFPPRGQGIELAQDLKEFEAAPGLRFVE
jgi:hypothetical protein